MFGAVLLNDLSLSGTDKSRIQAPLLPQFLISYQESGVTLSTQLMLGEWHFSATHSEQKAMNFRTKVQKAEVWQVHQSMN